MMNKNKEKALAAIMAGKIKESKVDMSKLAAEAKAYREKKEKKGKKDPKGSALKKCM